MNQHQYRELPEEEKNKKETMLGIGTGVCLKKVKNNIGKTIQKNYV